MTSDIHFNYCCSNESEPSPPPPNRIEFIPLEWYDKIHASNSALKNNLVSTTLNTIPKLRAIANDVIFDVLMYMTPEFCDEVLNCVTDQIIELYDLFKTINTDFSDEG
jgi:phospholipase DDHD2